MFDIIQVENIKYKRTFIRKLIIMMPIMCILVMISISRSVNLGNLKPWQCVLIQVFNWWPALFLPLVIALSASLMDGVEKKAGNYRGIRIHDIEPYKLWIGKIIIMAFYLLLCHIVIIVTTVFGGILMVDGTIPFTKIFIASFVIWICSISIIPIQLFIATWKGTVLSMSIGIIGIIVGVAAADKWFWMLTPWSIAVREMCPLIGAKPSGLAIESTLDPLLNPSVIPIGIIFSIILFSIFTFITTLWFNKREVK